MDEQEAAEFFASYGIDAYQADTEILKAAYRAIAKKLHPDRNGSLEDMKRLNRAYDVLVAAIEKGSFAASRKTGQHKESDAKHRAHTKNANARKEERQQDQKSRKQAGHRHSTGGGESRASGADRPRRDTRNAGTNNHAVVGRMADKATMLVAFTAFIVTTGFVNVSVHSSSNSLINEDHFATGLGHGLAALLLCALVCKLLSLKFLLLRFHAIAFGIYAVSLVGMSLQDRQPSVAPTQSARQTAPYSAPPRTMDRTIVAEPVLPAVAAPTTMSEENPAVAQVTAPQEVPIIHVERSFSASDRALAFMTRYYEAWSGSNDVAISFLRNSYADQVSYYGKDISRNAVMKEKLAFAKRWPLRTYALRKDSETIQCSTICRMEAVVDWSASSDQRGRQAAGAATITVEWDTRTEHIVTEHGKVLWAERGAVGPSDLISKWHGEDSVCRGSYEPQNVLEAACERRDAIGIRLENLEWCYGREGENGSQHEWHGCGSDSIRMLRTEAVSAHDTGTMDYTLLEASIEGQQIVRIGNDFQFQLDRSFEIVPQDNKSADANGDVEIFAAVSGVAPRQSVVFIYRMGSGSSLAGFNFERVDIDNVCGSPGNGYDQGTCTYEDMAGMHGMGGIRRSTKGMDSSKFAYVRYFKQNGTVYQALLGTQVGDTEGSKVLGATADSFAPIR